MDEVAQRDRQRRSRRAAAGTPAAANSAEPDAAGLDADLELGLGELDLLARAATRCRGWRRRRADRWSGRRGLGRSVTSSTLPKPSDRRSGRSACRRPAPRRRRRRAPRPRRSGGRPGCAAAARPRPAAAATSEPTRTPTTTGPPAAESAEGELADQQRDREADAGQHREPDDVDPGQVVVEVGVGEGVQQPGRAGDADRLAEDQTQDDAQRHRIASGTPQPVDAADGHPGGEEREDRHGDTADSGRTQVLQLLGQAVQVRRGRPGGAPER